MIKNGKSETQMRILDFGVVLLMPEVAGGCALWLEIGQNMPLSNEKFSPSSCCYVWVEGFRDCPPVGYCEARCVTGGKPQEGRVGARDERVGRNCLNGRAEFHGGSGCEAAINLRACTGDVTGFGAGRTGNQADDFITRAEAMAFFTASASALSEESYFPFQIFSVFFLSRSLICRCVADSVG